MAKHFELQSCAVLAGGMQRTTKDHDCMRAQRGIDTIALTAVLFYVAYRFMRCTMLPVNLDGAYRYAGMLVIICGIFRFVFTLIQDLRSGKGHANIPLTLGRCVIAGCLTVLFIALSRRREEADLMVWPFMVMCLYHAEPERVLRGYAIAVGTLLAATVVCCLAGVIKNINNGWGKASYGIINTTDFAAFFIFILIGLWCSRARRTVRSVLTFAGACVATALVVYHFSGSRTALACCLLVAVGCIWVWLDDAVLSDSQLHRILTKAVDALCIGSFPLMGGALALLTYLYGMNNAVAVQLNMMLSQRLKDTWFIFQTYGLKPFGTYFLMHGNGASLVAPVATYDFLDSFYAYLLIRLGYVATVIFTALWVWMTIRAIRGGRRSIAISLAIVAAYGFSECQLVNVGYCIFTVMPFCSFESERWEAPKEPPLRIPGLAARAALVGVVLLFAPRAMSWLRTFMFLNGWEQGRQTGYAFALCLLLVICVSTAWRVLPQAVERVEPRHGPCAALVVSVGVLAVAALAMNHTIQQGLSDWGMQLTSEEEAIRLVQSAASQPLYAMERSELYQRRFGDLNEHVMTVDDLVRSCQGTIIVDKDTESLRLPSRGALYLQFSDESGMYSFDPAVIDAMEAAGYQWTPFYSSERVYDLALETYRSNLVLDGQGYLMLQGPDHSFFVSERYDQVAGTYEVRFEVSMAPEVLTDLEDEEYLCTFQVRYGPEGEIYYDQPLFKGDFNQDGICSMTITYSTDGLPLMGFLMSVAGDRTLYVHEIAWRRIS